MSKKVWIIVFLLLIGGAALIITASFKSGKQPADNKNKITDSKNTGNKPGTGSVAIPGLSPNPFAVSAMPSKTEAMLRLKEIQDLIANNPWPDAS